jgi:hypothetical protein
MMGRRRRNDDDLWRLAAQDGDDGEEAKDGHDEESVERRGRRAGLDRIKKRKRRKEARKNRIERPAVSPRHGQTRGVERRKEVPIFLSTSYFLGLENTWDLLRWNVNFSLVLYNIVDWEMTVSILHSYELPNAQHEQKVICKANIVYVTVSTEKKTHLTYILC